MILFCALLLGATAFDQLAVFAVGEDNHGALVRPHHRRHHEVAGHVQSGELVARGYQFTGIRATYYGAGLGACGQTYSVNDFIVALSQSTFGLTYRSKYCDKEIIISYGGKTARAKIVDACVACSNYSPWALDFSEGLFRYFADTNLGVIQVSWSFVDGSDGGDGGGGGGNTPTPTPTPHYTSTSTSTHRPPPTTSTSTSHSTPPHPNTPAQHDPTHTTPHSTPTTTSSTHTSSSHHSTPKTSSTTSTRPTPSTNATSTSLNTPYSPTPTPSTSPSNSGNIYNLNQFIMNLENLIDAQTRQ